MKTKLSTRKLVAASTLAFVVAGYSIWALKKPGKWESVSLGMSADEIQELVGAPSDDSYELKGLQSWDSGRVLFQWRLRTVYNGGVARSVWIEPVARWLP